ncbi:MAG: transporter ATP-binding protein [Bacteroidetes bacterium]|nr:transporter ATP-binding protein [Bacteroidota bacterium]
MTHVLRLDFIEHRFGKKSILSKVNFICNTGDVIAIFGRNGSGKSTLLKSLFGTLQPNKIELNLDGRIINRISPKDKTIAYLPQDPFLPKDIIVRNIIPMYFPDGDIQNKIFYSPLIDKIENQRIGTLSLGELRYLEFLLIIHLDHPFILLDEPFSMIEPLYKDAIKDIIIEYKRNKGFIITDHYYSDVMEVANKKMILKGGVSQEVSDLKDLIENGYLPSAHANNDRDLR